MSKNMLKHELNQKRIAQQLGVSQMTISRVLNNQPGVGKKLKAKIQNAIKKYGYIPDYVASGLRSKSTRAIGLIIPDVSSSFFPEITKEIEKKAKVSGYSVILAHSYESYGAECEAINLLRGFRVRGFIIAPAGGQNDIDIYERLQKAGIPFVFIDRIKTRIGCSYVITDTQSGAASIGRYLAQKGYRKWGYLRGPHGISSSDEHYAGIRKSLKECGLGNDTIMSVKAGFDEYDGYNAAQKLLEKKKPDVIIAVNDPVAIGVYRFLKEKKIRVPHDIALVGFSDLKGSDIIEIPLTTVHEQTMRIGQEAFNVLLGMMNGNGETRKVRLETELVIRSST
ncbi:MAG: LacI family DNA-binding transcriptional regulator [Phycisphaerae bacterium]|jgi:LacI family transcriptional regulator